MANSIVDYPCVQAKGVVDAAAKKLEAQRQRVSDMNDLVHIAGHPPFAGHPPEEETPYWAAMGTPKEQVLQMFTDARERIEKYGNQAFKAGSTRTDLSPSQLGMREAEKDLARGKAELKRLKDTLDAAKVTEGEACGHPEPEPPPERFLPPSLPYPLVYRPVTKQRG